MTVTRIHYKFNGEHRIIEVDGHLEYKQVRVLMDDYEFYKTVTFLLTYLEK